MALIRLWRVSFLAIWFLVAYCAGFSLWGVGMKHCLGILSPIQSAATSLTPCHQHWPLQATSSEADTVLQTHNVTNDQQLTLYDILDASPLATRQELKERYYSLATSLHPDGVNYGNDGEIADNSDNTNTNSPPKRLFSDVAMAWSILRDPRLRKQYDRRLWFQQWSDVASTYTNQALEGAVPFVSKMVDAVAIPVMVSTATTTVAISQAVSQHMPFTWPRTTSSPFTMGQDPVHNQTNATTTTDDASSNPL